MLQFTVVDTGIGIDGEHVEHLFEAFTQADGSASRRKGGTGLGLAICKSLVEMMDGEIWAGGEIDRGSAFGFRIAFETASASPGRIAFEPLDEKEKNLPSPSKMSPLLRELSGLLKENNLKTDDCLSRIKKCLINTRLHETVVQLELQVISLDYQRAGITLDRIADVFSFSLKEI